MGTWVNFKEVRAKVSLEQVIYDYYRITTLKRQQHRLVGPCPVHGGDSPRAFHADLEKNVWHCFTQCAGGGNQLDFVAQREGISVREAALLLQEAFLDTDLADAPPRAAPPHGRRRREDIGEQTPTPAKQDVPSVNPVITVSLALRHDHPHLTQDRGLSVETCERFGVGYAGRGIMRGMIAIPIHDADGGLVAYAGRRLKLQDIREHGKYKLPRGFHKELELFNWHRVKDRAESHGVILVEGFFSVLKLWEAGFTDVVAAMGCDLSDAQGAYLAAAKEVIVLFDGNDAGNKGAERAKEKLDPVTRVRVARLPDGAEPEDLSRATLRWLVNGMRMLDLTTVSFWARTSRASEADDE